jgi:hypothetical protein
MSADAILAPALVMGHRRIPAIRSLSQRRERAILVATDL